MRIFVWALTIVLLALALAGCGTKCGDLPGTVASVNGKDIELAEYVNLMNARIGRDVLSSLIEQHIVAQWAETDGVAPTDAQVEKQIKYLKDERQYDEQVKILGEEEVKRELRNLQARINLSKKYTNISDDELEQGYNGMKTRFVRGPRKYVALIVNADKAKLDKAQKDIKGGKDFDEVAQDYADRRVSPRPPLKMWIVEGQQGMPEALTNAAKKTKDGEVSGVVTLSGQGGDSTHFIMKVLASQGAINKKLEQVRGEVEDAIAMQKSQYDPTFTKQLNEKIKAAKIEVNIPQYKDLVEQFKNPPEQPNMTMPQR